jgi:hypothetical protein
MHIPPPNTRPLVVWIASVSVVKHSQAINTTNA